MTAPDQASSGGTPPDSAISGAGRSVTGWRCAVCDADVSLAISMPWRCPNSTLEDRHHVLHHRLGAPAGPVLEDANPFIRFDPRLAWSAAAEAKGLSAERRIELVRRIDAAVAAVDGKGFRVTPYSRSAGLSAELGFSDRGGVWVKDETNNVAGSQKARHLFSILLHLLALEELGLLEDRRPLAIASCGNAALAAATLAAAVEWPIDVYVPTWMGDGFGAVLDRLGARTHRSERRAEDPPGDPAMHRFRDAVAGGSIPFTVQGPENSLCLDGGRTLGFELAEQEADQNHEQQAGRQDRQEGAGEAHPLRAVYVQIGGGALGTSLGAGLSESGCAVPLVAVQAAGCAPFARALERARGLDRPATSWDSVMTPWADPHSVADGILDDETYDWIGVLAAVRQSRGRAVVASEENIVRAHALVRGAGFDASPTGSSAVAGLLEELADENPAVGPDDRVCVTVTGVSR